MSLMRTGVPAPVDGKRALTAKEAQQRARAMACIRSTTTTQCQGQIFIGLFFDGTGNNHSWIEKGTSGTQRARNKHSNIARLWDSHEEDTSTGFFKTYIPGVGTPFEEIGDTTTTLTEIAGNGFGYMGADRICWAITSVLIAVSTYLTGERLISGHERKLLCQRMSRDMLELPIVSTEGPLRWLLLTALEEKLALVVKRNQRKVRQINLSIFGFSRGAATARACAHWLHQIFERDGGAFELAGIPVRIGFMGLFDTVAAVGIGDVTPITFGHMAWGKDTQNIHPAVEECVHFIALHEQRASFPLESATGRGNIAYPGMHSDVGGGYFPGEQGKSMPSWSKSPHLSQIPLIDMHFAALRAGVPLKTMTEIQTDPKMQAAFAVDQRLITAYNDWLRTNGIQPASVGNFTRAHTNQYLAWRGSMHKGESQLSRKRFYRDATGGDVRDIEEADAHLGIMLRAWRERQEANRTLLGRTTERARDVVRKVALGSRFFIDAGKDPLSSHEQHFFELMTKGPQLPAGTVTLFEDYIHDSRAGFRIAGYHEPEWLTGGYARYRNVFIQAKSDDGAYASANECLQSVKATAGASVEYFQKLYRKTVETYASARAKVENTYRRARAGAVRAAQAAGEAAVELSTEAGELTVATGTQVVGAANEAAKIYGLAQLQVLRSYNVAQDDLRRVLLGQWEQDEKDNRND